jgi:hypothetical protein
VPTKTPKILAKKIKINYVFPENIESKFVNQVVVQNQKDFFTLSFFETVMPIIVGESEEERASLLEKIESIDAKCIARFIVTPEKISQIVNALQVNIKRHDEMLTKKGQESEEKN